MEPMNRLKEGQSRRLVLLAVLAFGCFGPEKVDLDQFENDASEVVFRHMFSLFRDEGHGAERPAVYFIVFGNLLTDPRPSFISRFDDLAIPVKGFEGARLVDSSSLRDRGTGQDGVLFQVAKIKQISDSEVQLEAAFAKTLQGTERLLYTLTSDSEGGFTVARVEPYQVQLESLRNPGTVPGSERPPAASDVPAADRTADQERRVRDADRLQGGSQ